MTERETLLTWTNWTFGVWYHLVGRSHMWGIDLGPLEIVWKKPVKRRNV